jgi:predicted glycogen debranching enzyme
VTFAFGRLIERSVAIPNWMGVTADCCDAAGAALDWSPTVNPSIEFGRELCGDLEQALRREWLVTNGLGGYGAGTIAGCQTRRYHGLLVAAVLPPVGRTVLLVDLDVVAHLYGRQYELACHEYADGTIHPAGCVLVESFQLDGTVPTWTYALGPARLVKRVFMGRQVNTTYVTYTLARSPAPLSFAVRPLCTGRDHHWHRRGGEGFGAEPVDGGCSVTASGVAARLLLTADAGHFTAGPDIHWNLRHRAEAARGLDSAEDLYTPGTFDVSLAPGATVSFTATTEAHAAPAADALLELRHHEGTLLGGVAGEQPCWIRQLVLAADQFIVARRSASPAGSSAALSGRTVIAGYPWFGDWGRDTMIALPGLTLATGRPAIAAEILRTFADHVSDGLLPNRFPDTGETSEYNTVDATLWYFVAVHEYLRATGDLALVRELYPVLESIVDWYRRGTRHGISVDPKDGLLRAGAPGVQLTWMDAKVGDWVVTPRSGKAVEINALWCNALAIVGSFARQLAARRAAQAFDAAAAAAAASFAARFWFEDGGYLYDAIDGPDGHAPDTSLRPNQLLVLALPFPVLNVSRAVSVLAACERELLTSYGLRTLDAGHPAYAAHYGGDPRQRDGAYHQGTVWPWLLGAFVRAHLAVHGDPVRARVYLAPLEHHLADACIGQVSEIFDADPPHAPRGGFAQAWSVAEVLRSWIDLNAAATRSAVAAAVPSSSARPARARNTRK